jgi:hypothetical protein
MLQPGLVMKRELLGVIQVQLGYSQGEVSSDSPLVLLNFGGNQLIRLPSGPRSELKNRSRSA